jgi:hypothetical protein
MIPDHPPGSFLSARLLYLLRWFLELNRPSAYGSDAEVERNYRWNFTANLLDVTS